MLALAGRKLQLSVVDDQIGCPTWARNLARASCHLVRSGLEPSTVGNGNIYHYCDADRASWHDFAQMVFNAAKELDLLDDTPELKRVSSGEYPQIATRPKYSVLDTRAIRESGFEPASLAESLIECMSEIRKESDE
jgi:dTDP-4-dehydrorhamnose reductase